MTLHFSFARQELFSNDDSQAEALPASTNEPLYHFTVCYLWQQTIVTDCLSKIVGSSSLMSTKAILMNLTTEHFHEHTMVRLTVTILFM